MRRRIAVTAITAAVLLGSGQAALAGNGNGKGGGKPTTTTTTVVGTQPAELQVAPGVGAPVVYPCPFQGICGTYVGSLSARLRDAGTTKAPLPGRTVKLFAEEAFAGCEAVTNDHGVGTCLATTRYPQLLAGTVTATFAGDSTYAPTTGNSTDNPIVP